MKYVHIFQYAATVTENEIPDTFSITYVGRGHSTSHHELQHS